MNVFKQVLRYHRDCKDERELDEILAEAERKALLAQKPKPKTVPENDLFNMLFEAYEEATGETLE